MGPQPNLEQLPSTPLAIAETGSAPEITNTAATAKPRLLLVDDMSSVRLTLQKVLSKSGFEVETADSVNAALKLIGSQTFDVLLSDLHMPMAGDGLTVVSAMRHANPNAITLILSAFPAMDEAARAILQQADAVLVKPIAPQDLIRTILDMLNRKPSAPQSVESVATILETDTPVAIADWLVRINAEPEVVSVYLSDEDRSAHLPNIFRDLVCRLRNPLPLGTRALVSSSASDHGLLRKRQGYTAAMLVEESRMLQVTIFQTLQNHFHHVDFSLLLMDVMVIADEVDSQLAQAMASYCH